MKFFLQLLIHNQNATGKLSSGIKSSLHSRSILDETPLAINLRRKVNKTRRNIGFLIDKRAGESGKRAEEC